MSQSQGIEVRRPSRRTIATGAAWAVPVIAVGASAPAFASSPNECVPEFTVVPELSLKCCNGQVKNMKIVVSVTDPNQCVGASESVCILDASVATPNDTIGDVVIQGSGCTTEDGEITIFLLDVSNCTVNLILTYRVGDGPTQTVPLKSGNIPSGNTDGECEP